MDDNIKVVLNTICECVWGISRGILEK